MLIDASRSKLNVQSATLVSDGFDIRGSDRFHIHSPHPLSGWRIAPPLLYSVFLQTPCKAAAESVFSVCEIRALLPLPSCMRS